MNDNGRRAKLIPTGEFVATPLGDIADDTVDFGYTDAVSTKYTVSGTIWNDNGTTPPDGVKDLGGAEPRIVQAVRRLAPELEGYLPVVLHLLSVESDEFEELQERFEAKGTRDDGVLIEMGVEEPVLGIDLLGSTDESELRGTSVRDEQVDLIDHSQVGRGLARL